MAVPSAHAFIVVYTQFLPRCDRVIFMDNETISEIGTFSELMQNNAGFSTLYKAHTTDHDHDVRTSRDVQY